MKMLIQNSQGEMLTVAVEATDTFNIFKEKMLREYGVRMDFQNLGKDREINDNDSILESLAKNNQRLALEKDYQPRLQPILKKSSTPGASTATIFGTIILQPQAMQQEKIYDSDEDVAMVSNNSHAQDSMETTLEDQASLCRLCAIENNEMIPIFGVNQSQSKISRQIFDCFSIIVRKTDAAKRLCKSCLGGLEKFHEFRKNVLGANEKFERRENAQTMSESTSSEYSEEEPIWRGHLLARECRICNETFGSASSVFRHSLAHSSEGNYPCGICDKIFSTDKDYDEHHKEHTEDKTRFDRHSIPNDSTNNLVHFRVCTVCEQVFIEETVTSCSDRHANCDGKIIEEVLNAMYKCEFCGICYSGVHSLNNHKSRHLGATPYVCLICDVHFSNYNQAMDHKVSHKKSPHSKTASTTKDETLVPKYFSCQDCRKTFLHLRNVEFHRKFCKSINDCRCRSCGTCFADSSELEDHKKGNENDQKWQCDDCKVSFETSCALDMHKGKHMEFYRGKRIFSCKECGQIFRQKTRLDHHARRHTGERPYKCPTCDKTFTNTARLREHKYLHTGERHYKCKLCDKSFKRPNARKVHMIVHTGEKPYTCGLCSGTFKRISEVKKHKKTMHNINA